jgi:hypothetical protein
MGCDVGFGGEGEKKWGFGGRRALIFEGGFGCDGGFVSKPH